MNFLTPALEKALSTSDGSYKVRIDKTELRWDPMIKALDLRASGTKAFGPDGRVVASVPILSLKLSARAMLRGMIAPKAIELRHSSVRLVRDTGGEVAVALGGGEAENAGSSEDVSAGFFAELMDKPASDPEMPLSYLSKLQITDAKVSVIDRVLGTSWKATKVDFAIERGKEGLTGGGRVAFRLPDDTVAQVDMTLQYIPGQGGMTLGLSFEALRPAVFANLIPQFEQIRAVDLPLTGLFTLTIKEDGTVGGIGFDLQGGGGTLKLPAPLEGEVPLAGFTLRGWTSNGFADIDVDMAELDFGGPSALFKGAVKGLGGGDVWVGAETTIRNLPMNDLPKYWPTTLAPLPRAWIAENLTGGEVSEANFEMVLTGPDADNLSVKTLTGKTHTIGVTVGYLDPMPRVKDVSAEIDYYPDRLVIGIKDGRVNGLRINEGTIELTDLDKEDQLASVDLVIAGQTKDALRLLDSPPLGYVKELGVGAEDVGGTSLTHLRLKFPLRQDLDISGVTVKADSTLVNAAVTNAVLGKDLSGGALGVVVDNDRMSVVGTALLAGVPVNLNWRETFRGVKERSRYDIDAVMDTEQRRALGLDFVPLAPPFVDGTVKGNMVATVDNKGRGTLKALLDFGEASITIPGFGWKKEPGVAGKGDLTVLFNKDHVVGIPELTFSSPFENMEVIGHASMAEKDGRIQAVALDQLRFGRTDVKGRIDFAADGSFKGQIKGPSLDVSAFLETGQEDVASAGEAEELPPAKIRADVGMVWVSREGFLRNVVGNLARDKADWNDVTIAADIENGEPLFIGVSPGPDKRTFSVTSDNAGAFLRTFGFYDSMQGGVLKVDGTIDGQDVIAGTATINDFKVANAPVLAKLLTVASLTGLYELMQGGGITFSTLELPFKYAKGVITGEKGKAFGPALGITVTGVADLNRKYFDLDGALVPSYTLNSLLGNIPLLGRLFVGEEGGGLIAMNYSMRGTAEKSEIFVNPLSALTPGFLRNIFGIFDTSPKPDDVLNDAITGEGKPPEWTQPSNPPADPAPEPAPEPAPTPAPVPAK